MLKNPILYSAFVILSAVVGLIGCERDDSEPDLEMRKFTRLYISYEEYGTSNLGVPDTNIRVVYPADSSEFGLSLRHVSGARGGGPMLLASFADGQRRLLQASVNSGGSNDTSVYVMNVGQTGVLTNIRNGWMSNRLFTYVKGLAYSRRADMLFFVNGDGSNNSGIYGISQPRLRLGYTRPLKKYRTPGLRMWGAAYESDRLFTSNLGSNPGIFVFEEVNDTPVGADSSAVLRPARTLTIREATNLRGLFYDTVNNVLAITDFTDGRTLGSGKIFLFDNFSDLIEQEGDITPSRVITGPSTGLIQPVDVVLDTRENGVYLYVADRASRRVSRFRISDNGNVAPDKYIETTEEAYGKQATPVGLALDTRSPQ